MSEWNPKANEIFLKALDCESSESQQAYLDEICGSDKDLRAQVESLLEADLKAASFLGRPVAGDRPTDVLDALTDPEGPLDEISPPPSEISLDFLKPCNMPGRLGKLGPYEVIDVIGRGGMGVVLRAHDPKLSRVVAVKVLAPELAANPTARKRFLREARAAAAVSHPHVVTIHAVEEDDDTPYLVMECIDGQSLEDKIERVGTLPLKEILRIGSQIAAGLAAAHGQGLIHRDVKPGNVLLENGVERVKITDFGLARAVDDIGMTRTGEVAGTPEFMSPEQAQGLAVEHRSDLFSLGSVLYAMCTGRSPFRADTTVAVLRRVCDDEPRPIREINPEIPEGLVAIIDRLLAKSPDERLQTSQEVADLLGRRLAYLQHPTNTPPPGPLGAAGDFLLRAGPDDKPPVSPRTRPRRRLWAVAGLVLLALLAGLSITEATGVTQLAATVIRIATGEGTLVIEVDDPTVEVSLDGEELSITGAGIQELMLRPGQYQFQAIKDGQPVKQELVTITRGGRQVVKVRLERQEAADVSSKALLSPLEKEIADYRKVIEEKSGDPTAQREVAFAYAEIGQRYLHQSRNDEAERVFRKAIDVFEPVVESAPNDMLTRQNQIDLYLKLAYSRRGLVATDTKRKALALAEQLTKDFPDDRAAISYESACCLGLMATMGDTSEGRELLDRASALAESINDRLRLADVLAWKGRFFNSDEKFAEAEAVLRRAISNYEQLLLEPEKLYDPDQCRYSMASARMELANSLSANGSTPEAIEALRRAAAVYQEWHHKHPKNEMYRSGLARASKLLAEELEKAGKNEEEISRLRETVDALEKPP
ncbi:MAG: serine/threonine-protein kinase [Planctomycetota bacterium]